MRGRPVRLIAAAGITALIACGGEDHSQPAADSGRPSTFASGTDAPSDAAAVATSESAIEVRWRDNSSKETGFRVDRSTIGPGGPFYVRATTGSNLTRYTDSGLTPGARYCYRIAAVTHSGTSGFSNTACAVTPAQPRAPTNAVATPQSSTVVAVAWTDNSSNEDGFRLERAAASTGPWESAGTVERDVTALADVARATELLVCYRVIAFNANGVSSPSNVACTTPPAAPQALAAIGLDASTIGLKWIDQSAGESGYEVQRSLDQYGPFAVMASLPANASGYVEAGLASNTVYWYRVRAIKDGGFSDFSNLAFASANVRPAAPTDLHTTFYGGTSIFVGWTHYSATADSFRLEAATNQSGPWFRSWIVPADWRGFQDAAPPTDGYSCYRVFAFNASGESAPSNVACAIMLAAPTSLVATAVGSEAVDLRWNDNSGFEGGYEVNRGFPDDWNSWKVVAIVPANANSYRDDTVTPDTSYQYFVRARNGDGFSDWSNVVRVTAASKAPDPPTLNAVPAGSTAVGVYCSCAQGSDGHRLERSTDGGANWVAIPVPPGSECSSIHDGDRATEQQVCYRAFAANSMGESRSSNLACTYPPAAPGDLDATVSNGGTVNLTWKDNSAHETGYVVSRMLSFQEDWWATFSLPANETSCSDWPGGQDVVAIYQIVATVDGGQSDPAYIQVYVPSFVVEHRSLQ